MIAGIVETAARQGVHLYVDGETLRFSAKKGSLTDALRDQIKANKAEIIDYLVSTGDGQSSVIHPDLQKAKGNRTAPLSFAQQRLWFIDQLEGGSSQYNTAGGFRISGELNIEAFKQSLNAILERHEVLRTRFEANDGTAYQVVQSEFDLPLEQLDLSDLSDQDQTAQIQRHQSQCLSRSFDLSQDLMLRVVLLKLGEQEHVVLFSMHHIASDGWSRSILMQEFAALYDAFSQGESDPLPPLTVQYADYAHWQRDWLQGEVLERQMDYWREQLSGLPQIHSLPTDKPRPAQQSFRGRIHEQVFDEELTRQLNALCQRHDVTLFMLMQTAFALLLGRYSAETDIVMGTSIAGRTHRDIEPLIGFFVNTLVLRSDLSGDPAFSDLLAASKQRILDAYSHQHIPFEMLVEDLKPERSLSHNPLVQVLISLNNTQHEVTDSAPAGELAISALSAEGQASQFDFELNLNERGDQLYLGWQYNTDLFTEERVRRMAVNFEALLRQVLADSNQPIQSLSMVADKEQEQLVNVWSGTSLPEPLVDHLPGRFEAQVERTPEAIAVRFDDESLSYQALNEQSNQLAHYLIEQGVGADTRIGVCLEPSVDLMIAVLGVLKAGGAYVPLDPAYPEERIEHMLSDSGVRIVLTQNALLSELPLHEHVVLPMDKVVRELLLAECSTENPTIDLKPEDLAYMIYTSGSTGKPKGVEVPHGAVMDYCEGGLAAYYDDELKGSYVVTSLSFDATVPSVYLPLLTGGCVHWLASQDGAMQLWSKLLSDEQGSLVRITPSHIKMLSAVADTDSVSAAQHRFVIGGEALKPLDLEQLRHHFPSSVIYNHYGPTEGIVGCTLYDTTGYSPGMGSIPIGQPFGHAQVYVLDESQNLLPAGAVGELCVGRRQLARGYLNAPELTEERFIENPFGEGRLYRTGDRVRWSVSGELEFLGRMDHQVKIRGFRVELGEIEAQLLKHERVKDSAVLVSEEDEPRLLAYLSLHENLEGEDDLAIEEQKQRLLSELKESLRDGLPNYMVPSIYVVLDELPLSSTGKVDRGRLPAPDENDLQRAAYAPPRNELETLLCGLWEEVLGLAQVGIEDNFFDLGGHSLLATRLISMIREQCEVELPLRLLFEHPTIAELAPLVETRGEEEVMPSIDLADRQQPLPLSFAQQRLWFIDRLEGGSAQFNLPGAFRLEGKLDRQAFDQAIQALIERHEILRTAFKEQNGQAYQEVVDTFDLPVTEMDLSGLEETEQQRQIQERLANDARTDFALDRAPLMRVQLLHLSDLSHAVIFNMHHIVSDGWSRGILVREFSALYEAAQTGQTHTLPELKLQYADYAAWQRQWLQGDRLDQQLAFWRDRLSGIPQVHSLPLDHPRPVRQSFNGQSHHFTIDQAMAEAIRRACQKHDVTLFMFLQTAFSIVIGRYSHETDVVMGTPIAGRTHADMESMIGCFVNSLVLRSDLSRNPRFDELLDINKQSILDAYTHQHVPFEMLVDELKPERSLSHSPIYQIVFAVQNIEHQELQLPELTLKPIQRNGNIIEYDLGCYVNESAQGLSISLPYNTDLFLPQTIAHLADAFKMLLNSVVQSPQTPVHALPMLVEAEREQLLQWGWNARIKPGQQCIHQSIEQSADRYPEQVAVRYEDDSLSYQELNAQANQLAHLLQAQGVGPESRVGLLVQRSVDMVVGILAVLKAGGAYVPIDPAYPEQRIEHILDDSGVELVLTQSDLLADLPVGELMTIPIDGEMRESMFSSYPEENPLPASMPDNLAYVIYTSGSTGKPKGVEVSHGALVASTIARQEYYSDPVQAYLLLSSFAFDSSVAGIFWTLADGGMLCIADESDAIDARAICEQIVRNQISHMLCLPGLHQNVLATGHSQPESLTHVIVAGEKCSAYLLEQHFQRWPGVALFNEYGPTEAVVWSSVHRCQPSDTNMVPIGVPVAHVDLYVLNEALQMQGAGAIGELHVGGPNLARGYHQNPELTRERFIDNPFSGRTEDRLYKTGDLVRWLPDGCLEFVGRVDEQIKIRGFRIEPGEIESRLQQHDAVQDAVVMALEIVSGAKQLVAYLVVAPDAVSRYEDGVEFNKAALLEDLERHMKQGLPDYMLPSVFMLLDQLPLSDNGKLDRQRLPMPQQSDLHKADYVAPGDDLEKKLCELWQDVLKIERVGVEDSFFQLGGHSLLIMQLVTAVEAEFEIQVDVRSVFSNPTVRLQALAIKELQRVSSMLEEVAESPSDSEKSRSLLI